MGVKSHWLDQMSEGKMTQQIQRKSACPVVVSAYTYTTENNAIHSDVFAHWMTHHWRQRCQRNSNWSVHTFAHRWEQKMFYTLQAQEEHVDNTGIVRKLRTRSSEPPTWTKASNQIVHNNMRVVFIVDMRTILNLRVGLWLSSTGVCIKKFLEP